MTVGQLVKRPRETRSPSSDRQPENEDAVWDQLCWQWDFSDADQRAEHAQRSAAIHGEAIAREVTA